MVCSSSWNEDSPAREKQRNDLRKEKQAGAIGKIRSFLAGIVGEQRVLVLPGAPVDNPRRIDIRAQSDAVCFEHRGHSIIAQTETPVALVTAFRTWRQETMSHAKVFPRAP
jgi:hypothetical protein